jgi:hypothetical protein
MANFLLLYHGGKMGETPAEREASMAAWGAWFGSIGDAVVDGGNPCSGVKTVTKAGATDGGASGIGGYSVLKANSLADAAKLAAGCPVVAGGGSVEVYETFNAM